MGDKPAVKWDPYKLMNVTQDELKAVAQRKNMSEELKAKWQRLSTNPHAGGRGGHHLDPGVQRWLAARNTARDHFKVTPRTTILYLLMVWLPIGGFGYKLYTDRTEFDAKCRRGEISARERLFKFVN